MATVNRIPTKSQTKVGQVPTSPDVAKVESPTSGITANSRSVAFLEARQTLFEDHYKAHFENSSKEALPLQSQLSACQRDCKSQTQALHDALARECAERQRADTAEALCKVLRQRKDDKKARVARAHDAMQRAQKKEKETSQAVLAMEKAVTRQAAFLIGEEKHINYFEGIITNLDASLIKANDATEFAKLETALQRLRVDTGEDLLQKASDQIQESEKQIQHLKYTVDRLSEKRVKEQRRAELAKKEHGRLSTLLAAKTRDCDPNARQSWVQSVDAGHPDPVMQTLLALYEETQELRSISYKHTLKLS